MSITSRINEMSSHIEQAYDELQGLGADLTNVNKNIENISMVLDDIYDSMPQVSGEGTSLTLDDTRVGKIKSTLKGNTSQTGTPTPSSPVPVNVVSGDNEILVNGKNLLKINDMAETTTNGITYSCKDGVLTLNGTTTSGVTIDFEHCLLPSGTYYISRNGTGTTSGSWQTYLRNDSANIRQGEGSFTTTEGQYVYFRLFMNSGVVFTNYTFKPMINLGSTKIDFEPYQGNTYNIDLPVENVLNLGNVSGTSNQVQYSINSNGELVLNGTCNSDRVTIDLPTQQVIKGKYTFSTNYLKATALKNGNGDNLFLTTSSNGVKTETINDTITQLVIYGLTGVSFNNQVIKLMLEKGSKANSYTPYGTTPIELCKIGNYQDYIYKDSDKWYLHKEVMKYTFKSGDFTRYASIDTSTRTGFYAIRNDIDNYSSNSSVPLLLNRSFIPVSQAATWVSGNMSRATSIRERVVFILGGNKDISDIENVLVGYPLYYPLATPTNTEITYQPLIDQLNLLEKAQSKENQTNISQVNNDLPFIISASALKEWQESTSLNSTLSMVNPLSLGNTLNTQENNTQPIEVDNIEPLEEEENEES